MSQTRWSQTGCQALLVMAMAAGLAGCELGVLSYGEEATSQWDKTYSIAAGGSVEVDNVNGKIDVSEVDGNSVEVRAERVGKGATEAAATRALERIEIVEDVTSNRIRLETRTPPGGWLSGGQSEVRYDLRVPAGIEVKVNTTNGTVRLTGVTGDARASTTNGSITARRASGGLELSTTNGAIDVEAVRVGTGGINLETVNGSIELRLPESARATISAQCVNGRIKASDLSLERAEQSSRRLDGELNGGGPPVRLQTVNGGISIARRPQ